MAAACYCVGTYDQIIVRKLYSYCRPIQFMQTSLIISLHGVVLFFVWAV